MVLKQAYYRTLQFTAQFYNSLFAGYTKINNTTLNLPNHEKIAYQIYTFKGNYTLQNSWRQWISLNSNPSIENQNLQQENQTLPKFVLRSFS